MQEQTGKSAKKITASSPEWVGPLPSKPLKLALGMYKFVNNTGALHTKLGSRIFSTVYFAYKSFFGDNFKALLEKHPEFFTGGHIIDVGANIGYTAYLFQQKLTSPFKVIAFEPEEKNFIELERNIKLMKISEKVLPVKAALGEATGKTLLWYNPSSHADHRIVDEKSVQLEGEKKLQEIVIHSLDAFLEANGLQNDPISFIKVDVQGYEAPVLKGMMKTLANHPKATLVLEYSPHTMKQLGFEPAEMIQSLKNEGYELQVLNRDGSLSPFDSQVESSGAFGEYYDILCRKSCH